MEVVAGVMLWTALQGAEGEGAGQIELMGQVVGSLVIVGAPLTMRISLYVSILLRLVACYPLIGNLVSAGVQGMASGLLQTAALAYASELLEDNCKLRAFRLLDFAISLGLTSSPAPAIWLELAGVYVFPAIGAVLLLCVFACFQEIAVEKPAYAPPRTCAALSVLFLQFALMSGFTLLESVPKPLLLSRSVHYTWGLQDTPFLLTTALSSAAVAWMVLGTNAESQERELMLVCQMGAGVGWLFLCDYSPAVPFTWLLLGYGAVLFFSLPLNQVLLHTVLSRALGPNTAVSPMQRRTFASLLVASSLARLSTPYWCALLPHRLCFGLMSLTSLISATVIWKHWTALTPYTRLHPYTAISFDDDDS